MESLVKNLKTFYVIQRPFNDLNDLRLNLKVFKEFKDRCES